MFVKETDKNDNPSSVKVFVYLFSYLTITSPDVLLGSIYFILKLHLFAYFILLDNSLFFVQFLCMIETKWMFWK